MSHRSIRLPLIIVTLIGVVVLCVISLRKSETMAASKSSVRTAAVAIVGRENLFSQVEIPAEFRPYAETELHAKVSGYLQTIHVDFGDVVKSGQLLAVLEVPELKAELDASIAAVRQAQADYTNAHLIYERLVAVNKEHPNLVAQQEIDTAFSKDKATAATVSSAEADVEKYQTLYGYTQITAPFDGVITWRYVDTGALIQAGTASGMAKPVLRISDNYHLRLDFPVSVKYVRYIQNGSSVQARVDSLGGKMFTGVITRFTRKVDDDTRTMTTESEFQNPNLEITPGMYAAVVLNVQGRPSALAVPIDAVSSGPNPSVYLVNADNEIELREIKVGIESPTHWEVLAGLKEGDRVVMGNRGEIHPGQKVEPKPVQLPAILQPHGGG